MPAPQTTPPRARGEALSAPVEAGRRRVAFVERPWLYPIVVATLLLVVFHVVVAIVAPEYWFRRARWDEEFYVGIAHDGYKLTDGDFGKYSGVAFSPGWPMVLRGLWRITGLTPLVLRLPVAGLLSIVGLALLGWALRGFSQDQRRNNIALTIFAVWPGAMFFRTAYSETLYLPLVAVFFGFLLRRHYLPAAICVAFGWFTRTPAGVLAGTLTVAILLEGLRAPAWRAGLRQATCRLAWALPIAGLGMAGYIFLLWAEVGDPGAFLRAYSAWAPLEVDDARNLSFKGLADLCFQSDQPTTFWSMASFVAIPFLIVPLRATMPAILTVFTLGGWLFFLTMDWVKYPYHDMARWTAVLFPVHVCIADLLRKNRLATGLAVVVLVGMQTWFVARFAKGLYVS